MTSYVFGKDITRNFYPLEDNEPINLPSQVPSIYLFSSMPTLDDARSGIGALSAAVNYWEETNTAPFARTYTIPAIIDPNPTSNAPCLGYWEAVNYIVQTSGQVQTKLRQFDVEKAKATETVPATVVQDLKDIYPQIGSYVADDTVLANFIKVAEDQIKLEFREKCIDWGDVVSLKDVKYALAFLTIQLVSESQINSGDDKFAIRAEIYSKRYASTIAQIKIKYDSNGDGKTDKQATFDGALVGSR